MSKYVKPEVEEITVKCPDIMSKSVGLNIPTNTIFDTESTEPSEVKIFNNLQWNSMIY